MASILKDFMTIATTLFFVILKMSKYIFGSIVLVLSVICFVNGETSVKVTIPQKNPGYFNIYLVNLVVPIL